MTFYAVGSCSQITTDDFPVIDQSCDQKSVDRVSNYGCLSTKIESSDDERYEIDENETNSNGSDDGCDDSNDNDNNNDGNDNNDDDNDEDYNDGDDADNNDGYDANYHDEDEADNNYDDDADNNDKDNDDNDDGSDNDGPNLARNRTKSLTDALSKSLTLQLIKEGFKNHLQNTSGSMTKSKAIHQIIRQVAVYLSWIEQYLPKNV